MNTRTSFRRDTGLQIRMLLTIAGLGVLYAALVGALFLAGASGIMILLIGGGLALFQFFASDKLALRAMGAREVTPSEAPELHAMIDRLSASAGIPKPRVAVAATPMPNAFAMGRSPKKATVCATTGIMETLTPEELEGVMAHEVTHIVNRDVMTMTIASFFASIASMIVQFGFFFGGGFGGYDDEDSHGALGMLALVAIGAVVWIVSFFLMMALSRYREFAADRGAAELTGRPMALASALEKIAGGIKRSAQLPDDKVHSEMNAFYIFPARAKASLFNLFTTHPPMEKRIAALSRLDAEMRGATGIFAQA